MNETELKIQELKRLGLKRQKSCYKGHHSIAKFHNGKYESDFVSPYTKSAGNVNFFAVAGVLHPQRNELGSCW